MSPSTALVFCGGGRATTVPHVPDAFVVAADVGVTEAHRLGLHVDLLVGDLDSVTVEQAEAVTAAGGRVTRHPADKDATDLELAIEAAAAEGIQRVVVVGGRLGRLDHLLGNALLLASPRFTALRIDAVLGPATLHVVRDRRELDGTPGELVSLFALGGPARGVSTTGLRWALAGRDLDPGSSIGTSNRFVERSVSIAVDEGVVLAVRPGEEDDR